MTKLLLYEKAIQMRQKGRTYTEIKEALNIPKSTLSHWLASYPLTETQLLLLKNNVQKSRERAIEKYRATMQAKRTTRLSATYESQKQTFLPLSQRELEIAGLFLYWGEGQKRINGSVSISNTDPSVVRFSLYWLTEILQIPQEKILAYLQLYSDMNIEEEVSYWNKELQLPLSQFKKPYVKKSLRSDINHKGFGHGTCTLVVHHVLLKERIMMSIKSIADFYCSGGNSRL